MLPVVAGVICIQASDRNFAFVDTLVVQHAHNNARLCALIHMHELCGIAYYWARGKAGGQWGKAEMLKC